MKWPSFISRRKDDHTSPTLSPETLPVLWLLGKTGAGKSSLIRTFTGLSEVEVGNGFAPCTKTAQRFDFPADEPLIRFLDTRGLGEAGYDPAEDLAASAGSSHAILAVARLDDPVQGEVADVIAAAVRREADVPILVVHTAGDLIESEADRARARAVTMKTFERAAKRTLPDVEMSMPPDTPVDPGAYDALVEEMLELLPSAALLLQRRSARTGEPAAFEDIKRRVLAYSSAAGTSDIAPIVGVVTVPAIQMAMLRELGNHYGVTWTRRTMAEFAGALGVGLLARFGGSFGLREISKLIPGYGQTVGAALAGSLSFAATYALGRVAAYYLHARASGRTATQEELRAIYAKTFERAKRDD